MHPKKIETSVGETLDRKFNILIEEGRNFVAKQAKEFEEKHASELKGFKQTTC